MPRGQRGSLVDREAKSRIQLELHPKNREQLERLLAQSDAASYSEVVRRSIVFLSALYKAQEEGLEFGIFDPKTGVFTRTLVV